ncbi:MAG: PEP-CTERM sorting domain-containing protein [Gemmatimonas sp.]
MKKLHFVAAAVLAAATALPSVTFAQPACAGFGSAPSATFGGTGIPNAGVSYNNCVTGVSLNLTAHQRYDNAALTNNGAGVFTAQAGQDANTVSPVPGYAKWNFGWDIQGANVGQYTYSVLFDMNPGANTAQADLGSIIIPNIFPGVGYANSWNLGMGFLPFGFVGPAPAYTTFDPNAAGEYSFAIVAYDSNQGEVARTSMVVNTVSTVPEPSTYALMTVGLFAVGFAARRKRLA